MAEAARHMREMGEGREGEGSRSLTRFHERLLAEELLAKSGDSTKRLASALSEARVDLNPHQVEAAAFALESLSRGGCMLADEVGLGKTIEAGIVLAQLVAEGKSRILILSPATLRAQWQAELREKFDLESVVVDGRTVRASGNLLRSAGPGHLLAPVRGERPSSRRRSPGTWWSSTRRTGCATRTGREQDRQGAPRPRCATGRSCCSPRRRCRTS